MTSRAAIYDKAGRVRRAAGVDGFYPVKVERIAEHLGYRIQYFESTPDTRDVAGAVSFVDRVIYLNDSDPARWQMFACAHELGHIVLHADQEEGIADLRAALTAGAQHTQREHEANWFAAALLMPSAVFAETWRACEGDIAAVAGKFGVCKTAVHDRARELELLFSGAHGVA